MANRTDILIYQIEDGNIRIDVRLENETVWMTQKAIADLYQSTKQNISLHIKNIFEEEELDENAVVKYYLTTAKDGKNYKTKHYNLEIIIAIGYRVRSHRGTQFRKWATERLNEYLVKGFTMDDDRLKEMRNFGQDYFEELLERIRDIRASEKRFYQKITDIYATSVDYDSSAEITQEFFATVQNKLHYAIHGQTAAELIVERAKADKENMGLTSWKGSKVRQSDVTAANNYLTEKELKSLNRFVTMYLDYAEDQAERQRPMHMQDWIGKLDAFLQFNDREILANAGKVSKVVADELATQEYGKYSQNRIDNQSEDDFERFIENNNLKK
ncbi:virulence RhuM family protein [Virgibacillus ihumii]|uniref:virulence RhuM family protein n=1 Tax=Virgibacillus ihumii TaxID=2686091 RepID=UPI00157CC830|nr:virulence RhuM family protein [Virgibacillus ihumii]